MKRRKENVVMKKFCTKCGKPFEAVGREVICPQCKQAAAEDAKRAAVLKAKRASWAGESVPVRISGRASTVIREYGKAHNIPFAESLDELLRATPFFMSLGVEWSTIVPYKSRRRDKHATEKPQEAPQASKQAAGKQNATEKPQEAPQAAKVANKTSTVKKAIKTTSKTSTAAAGKGGKA